MEEHLEKEDKTSTGKGAFFVQKKIRKREHVKIKEVTTSEGFIQAHIYMVRGDCEAFTVRQQKDGEEIPFEDGETITMTVRKLAERPVLIEKKITSFTDGKAVIEILPEDTKNLDFAKYKYDIQKTKNGRPKTLIYYSDFVVMEENSDD